MNEIEIEPQALRQMIEGKEAVFMLDCREPWEFETASIEGSEVMLMHSVPHRMAEIPRNCGVVVICHSGRRSLEVALWLRGQGLAAKSLSGGIDRWAREIDRQVPRY